MTSRPTILYPALVVAAISVTILSVTGIAALTGHLPGATATTHATPATPAASAATPSLPGSPAGAQGLAAPLPQDPTWRPLPRAGSSPATGASVPPQAASQVPGAPDATPPRCPSCGVVQSVREVQTQPSGSGVGAVAGGVIGGLLGNQIGHGNGRAAMTILGAGGGAYAGNEIEKATKRSWTYEVRVRMDNGRLRVLHQHERPPYSAGARVRIVDGTAVLAG